MPPKMFSGKQKKEQLKAKRHAKQEQQQHDRQLRNSGDEAEAVSPHVSGGGDPSTRGPKDAVGATFTVYGGDKPGVRSMFAKESRTDIDARKRLSYQPLTARDFTPGVPFGKYFSMLGVQRENLEEQHFSDTIPFSVAVPTRASMVAVTADDREDDGCSLGNKDFERKEEAVFQQWLAAVDALVLPEALAGLQPNSFERNLDVWRQLWRTVELSDVVCIVADVRYPIVHLPWSLLYHVLVLYGRPAVVCLNKADLVAPSVVEAWQTFLGAYFVATGLTTSVDEVPFVTFTSLPEAETALGAENQSNTQRRKAKQRTSKQYEDMKVGRKIKSLQAELGALHPPRRPPGSSDSSDGSSDEGAKDSDSANSDTYATGANFIGKAKAEKLLAHGKQNHKELARVAEMIEQLLSTCKRVAAAARLVDGGQRASKKPGDASMLTTIGLVGHPNVGKSSLLNAVRGAKAVSVSATAGHTKHLQTIPIPADGVVIVDCPGLAFPVLGMPRPLQAVIGTHQVAQTRDPQSGVAYLASRLPLERIYGLRRVDGGAENEPWSAYDLCESFAIKKGFMVKHGRGVADIHRAAIAILQEAYQGRLVLYFTPPPLAWLASEGFCTKVRPHLHICPLPLVPVGAKQVQRVV